MGILLFCGVESKVQQANDLKSTEDNKSESRSNGFRDHGEGERKSDIQYIQQNVRERETLVDEMGREVLRRHHVEQRSGSGFEAEQIEDHSSHGHNGQPLDHETRDDAVESSGPDDQCDGSRDHDCQSDGEDPLTRHLVHDRHEDEDRQHVPQAHDKQLR